MKTIGITDVEEVQRKIQGLAELSDATAMLVRETGKGADGAFYIACELYGLSSKLDDIMQSMMKGGDDSE